MAIGKEGNVKWVDGLRGIASTLVVLTHIARAFDPDLFSATDAAPSEPTDGSLPVDFPPRLLQRPWLRILTQGRVGVAIFSLVAGYVCALKPVRLARAGRPEAALGAVSRSALRRVPRLALPTAVATLLIWAASELLGAFAVGRRTDSFWISFTSPPDYATIPPDPENGVVGGWSLGRSLAGLVNGVVGTWAWGSNMFDANMWTLQPLLKGSMIVYVFVVATVNVRPRHRMLAALGMWLYYYVSNDSAFGMQFFWGVFLADLQNHPPATNFLTERPRLCAALSFTCLCAGLTIASFPEHHCEWAAWSRAQHRLLIAILPRDADLPRFASGLGLELVSLALHFSPWARDLLSGRHFLWLGKQSFAVYLLHGPLLRTVLVWMVYGVEIPADVVGEDGEVTKSAIPFPGKTRLFLALPFWVPLNYGVAVLWTTYVDPWCARVTERLVDYVMVERDEKGEALPV